MDHQNIARDDYHISHIAEWFHIIPHIDIVFQPVNATFDPSNSHYLEALGIITAVPGFVLIFILLAFLVFFLCRCCDSGVRKKRKITPLKWILGLFAVLCCGALAVGLYGNYHAHRGMETVQKAAVNIKDSVQSLKEETTRIKPILQDEVIPDLTSLKKQIDAATWIAPQFHEPFKDAVDLIQNNVTFTIKSVLDISFKIESFDFQAVTDAMEEVEYYRWPSTIGLLSLLILLCLMLIWGVIKHSRCLLILFSVFGLLSVVICWILVSAYLGLCVAGSDFCLEPEPFFHHQAHGVVETGVLNYYLHCDPKDNPFTKDISDGIMGLDNATNMINFMSREFDDVFKSAAQLQTTRDQLKDRLEQAKPLVNGMMDNIKCNHNNKEYRIALEAACNNVLEGTAFMLVSAFSSGLLFTVLIWVASHTWIHIRKKPVMEHIDEEDPFLPPSAMMNPRRNRDTYGSTGLRPRSSHTPPHTPYFNAPLNGHSGNHDDHNYLHGRYTPPPAPDADLTCATKF